MSEADLNVLRDLMATGKVFAGVFLLVLMMIFGGWVTRIPLGALVAVGAGLHAAAYYLEDHTKIGAVGTVLGEHGVNIATFALGRTPQCAIGVVGVDADAVTPGGSPSTFTWISPANPSRRDATTFSGTEPPLAVGTGRFSMVERFWRDSSLRATRSP